MAAGAEGVEMACRIADQAALMTLPERRQRVHTRSRWMPPFTKARTRWRFGSKRRGVTLCAWLMFRPTAGPFPQISQRFAMVFCQLGCTAAPLAWWSSPTGAIGSDTNEEL